MLIPTFQMRAPSKRWIVVAGVLVVTLVSIAWSFDRFVLHARGSGGTAVRETADARRQTAVPKPNSIDSGSGRSSESPLVDSDNDGIPDRAELRTFQDR